MTLASVTKASEVFRDSVASKFDLEEDFLSTITELFVTAATPLAEAAKKAVRATAEPATVAEPKVRARRKTSAYNVYVREQMKTPDIQGVDHKQKMGAIATRWNALTEDEKKVYTDMANSENVEHN